jgi:hypothetical protein
MTALKKNYEAQFSTNPILKDKIKKNITQNEVLWEKSHKTKLSTNPKLKDKTKKINFKKRSRVIIKKIQRKNKNINIRMKFDLKIKWNKIMGD